MLRTVKGRGDVGKWIKSSVRLKWREAHREIFPIAAIDNPSSCASSA